MTLAIAPWEPPANIDPECIEICRAMNAMPGIRTIDSCCGHGEYPFKIFFIASNLEALPPLLYWFNVCHSGRTGWNIKVSTDCAMSPVTFVVEGPIGAYDAANHIAALLHDSISSNNDDS